MHEIDIKHIDLNLLTTLKVLLDEKNVTKASEKLNLSQSATSHALKRLRKMFKDPLLERSSAGMRPTPRALALRETLEDILLDIEQLVTKPVFIPASVKGILRIAASDYGTTVILPTVLQQLSQKSPHIDIECYDWQPDTLERIKNREIDLGLGVIDLSKTDGIEAQNLFSENFVSIVRNNHPILQENIDIESYISYPHALISTGSPIHSIKNSPKSRVDSVLESLGVNRRVMVKLPHFFSAALIVSKTNIILTLPRRVALHYANKNITLFEPPIDLGEYTYMQIWSKHCNNVPFQVWIRNLISDESQCM